MNKNTKKQEPNAGPVHVALPNTVKEKMEAISNLSYAIVELSRAINSVNVNVSVSGCTISGAETAISVKTDQ